MDVERIVWRAWRRERRRNWLARDGQMIRVSPTYLSRSNRTNSRRRLRTKVKAIAKIIDPDELLALAGRVSSDISEIIKRHPVELADLLRITKGLKAEDIVRLARDAQKAKDK